MEQHGFDGYEHHRREHQQLLQDVSQRQRQFSEGNLVVDKQFISFLRDWVVDHLLTED